MKLFATDLYDFTVDGYDELLNDLITFLLDKEKSKISTEGYSLKGRTGWHSPSNLCVGDDPMSLHLKSVLYTATKNYALEVDNGLPPLQFCNIDCWGMIMRAGDYSTVHSHPGCKYSGVLYLKVPENMPENEGNLMFVDPRSAARSSKIWGSLLHREKPERAKGFVFPNWLEHYVEAHFCDDVRISLAWNVEF